MRQKYKILIAAALTLVALGGSLGLWAARRGEQARPHTRTGFLLNTAISITLYGPDAQPLLDECFARIAAYENLFSRTIASSDVGRINAASGERVPIDGDTRALIALGQAFGERTGGAFDITIAPLSTLWDVLAEHPRVPAPDEIEAARALVDYRKLTLEEGGARLEPGMGLDLGGIAKGYIADRLRDLLRARGASRALINLGGNVYALGARPDGGPFRVGLQKPFGSAAEIQCVLAVADRSVVTSGTYERGFEQRGVWYHHILDPRTGYPARTGLSSVTIISQNSADGDALSTACLVLGEERARELLLGMPGIQAVFIRDDGSVSATDDSVFADTSP